MTALPSLGVVRPALEADLPVLADLRHRVFGGALPPAELLRRLRRALFEHPFQDHRLPSLLWESRSGAVAGCLGVMPRPMWHLGRSVTAAIAHGFMVAPEQRACLAGIELLRRFLAGPQDLSVAEGNDASRRLWCAAGGAVAQFYSIRWTRPLRPARYGLDVLGRRGLPPLVARLASPACAAVDALAWHARWSPLRAAPPEGMTEELTAPALAVLLDAHTRRRPLRPRDDAASLAWLFGTLQDASDGTRLRAVLLRHRGVVSGWYVYRGRPGAVAEVIQIGTAEGDTGDVLDHLFQDARRHGAIAVSGQLEPALVPALSERSCVFHRGRDASWVLVHSRNDAILRTMQLGEAFFSRLEGEWCLVRGLTG